MKRLLYILLAISLVGCNKFESTPIDTIDKRVNETITSYNKILSDSEFGWKAYLLTDIDVAVDFTFKFDGKNRVIMDAEFDGDKKESSYLIKGLQRPTLLFDTYSTLHMLSDPNPNVIGGQTGAGYYGDFEFAIISATADKVVLEGILNKSKLVLVKAKSNEDLDNSYEITQAMLGTLSKLRTYFKRTEIDGKDYEVKIDLNTKRFELITTENEVRSIIGSNFYVTGSEVSFFEPLIVGKDTLMNLKNVTYNTSGYLSADLGGSNLKITESTVPMNYDKTAVDRFWKPDRQLSYSPWVKDGVSDYLNDASITTGTGINQRVAWLGYGDDFDLIAYAANYQLRFGVAISYDIDRTTGLIKYDYYGVLGTLPAAYRNIILQTATDFTDPKGLYVIETGVNQYDLVSVTDARKWLSFKPL